MEKDSQMQVDSATTRMATRSVEVATQTECAAYMTLNDDLLYRLRSALVEADQRIVEQHQQIVSLMEERVQLKKAASEEPRTAEGRRGTQLQREPAVFSSQKRLFMEDCGDEIDGGMVEEAAVAQEPDWLREAAELAGLQPGGGAMSDGGSQESDAELESAVRMQAAARRRAARRMYQLLALEGRKERARARLAAREAEVAREAELRRVRRKADKLASERVQPQVDATEAQPGAQPIVPFAVSQAARDAMARAISRQKAQRMTEAAVFLQGTWRRRRSLRQEMVSSGTRRPERQALEVREPQAELLQLRVAETRESAAQVAAARSVAEQDGWGKLWQEVHQQSVEEHREALRAFRLRWREEQRLTRGMSAMDMQLLRGIPRRGTGGRQRRRAMAQRKQLQWL